MAITSKPDAVPTFASSDVVDGVTGTNNVVEPDAAKKATGWLFMEYPARNIMNWLHRKTYQYINYFDQFHTEDEYVVVTQTDFNSVLERVAANQYKIVDDCIVLKVYPLSGGYQMSGALSGGDTWGYIETNNCTHVEFMNGAFIDMENTQGYFEVNTEGCYLKNVDIQGTGTVASAITQSFLLNENYVTFDNCRTSSRLSNTNFSGFKGSGTALHNKTSKYINCSVYDLTSSGYVIGFYLCYNGVNSICYNLESTASYVAAIGTCVNFINSIALELDGSTYSIGIGINSMLLINSYIEDLDSSSGEARPISAGDLFCNAYVYDCQSAVNQNIYGIRQIDNVSNIKIQQLDTSGTGIVYGMNGCNQVSSVEMVDLDGAAAVYGVYQCNQLSSLHIEDLDSSGGEVQGIYDSDQIASSYVYDLLSPVNEDIYGMNTVNNIAACKIQQLDTSGTGVGYGFASSGQIAATLISDIDTANGIAYGAWDTDVMVGCQIFDLDSSSNNAIGITGDILAGNYVNDIQGSVSSIGINGNIIAGCSVFKLDGALSNAFFQCTVFSGCKANDIDASGNANGFYDSDYFSACHSSDIDSSGGTASGFDTCTYGAALFTGEATNGSCDWIDTVDAQITNKVSTPSVWT